MSGTETRNNRENGARRHMGLRQGDIVCDGMYFSFQRIMNSEVRLRGCYIVFVALILRNS
jgi:hypothetical protein